MIRSAWNLKVRGALCALRFVRVVDISISHGGCDECGRPMPLSVTLTGVCGRVGLASPSIKRNLSIF